jgi:hypothetical protein
VADFESGIDGVIQWRADGKELYCTNTDIQTGDLLVMAVDTSLTPWFKPGAPKVSLQLTGPFPGGVGQWKSISRDGQQFVFTMPASPPK